MQLHMQLTTCASSIHTLSVACDCERAKQKRQLKTTLLCQAAPLPHLFSLAILALLLVAMHRYSNDILSLTRTRTVDLALALNSRQRK